MSKSETTTAITVRVPKSVVSKVKARLNDPVYKRVRYGAMSGLITKLLLNWLEDADKADPTKPQLDLSFLKKDLEE